VHADLALDYARKMPDKLREAQALLIHSDLRFGDGEMDGALADQQRAIELYRDSGDEQGTIDALTGMGSLLARRGEFELAMARFGETLARAEAGGHESCIAWALDRRAWFGHLIGRNEQARADAERGIQIYRELGNELAESSALNTLASIEQAQGKFDAALAHFEEYHVIAESWQDNGSLAAYHNNVGEVHISLGDYERAAEHFRQSIVYGERVRYFTAITAASANLARVHLLLGQGDEALTMTQRSIKAAEQTGLEPRIIDARYYRGRVLRELGRGDEAREILQPLLERTRTIGMRVTVAVIQTELGILAWQEGKQTEARSALNGAIELAHEMANPNLLWKPLLHLARSQRDGGDKEAALDSYREALTSLETVRVSLADAKQGASFQSKHGDLYRELVDLLLELGREEEAWSVIGLMKSEELRELDKRTRKAGLDDSERALMNEAEDLLSREARLAKQLAEEQAKPETERRADFVDELKAEIKSIQKQFRKFIRGLASEHGELVERLEIQPSNLKALQKKLKEGEAFLEPLVLPDRLVLFLVRAGRSPLVYREIEVAESRVDSLIRTMRESLSRPGNAWDGERAARLAGRRPLAKQLDPALPARELHELLLRPLAGDLQGVEHLIVSPSGRLRYIPFAALYDGEHYLLERFTLSTLTQAGAMGSQSPISETPPLLAFGNPDGSLPGAEREVKDLALLWNPAPVETVFGTSATMERLEEELEDYRILHLATHGVLRSDRPEDSYILLAGDDGRAALKLMDIVTLPLYDIELAVLSACQTALGTDGTGREITSLAHTFEQTGASAVVASLWSVSDNSTTQLMLDFYTALLSGESSRAAALRQAQTKMLADTKFAHPYYWAPFILIGNWH
jgi:CHAT domain-containing protein